MPSPTQTTWQQRLRLAIQRDPKKAAFLAGLTLVLLIVAGRAFSGAAPKAAVAKNPPAKSKSEQVVKIAPRRELSAAMRHWLAAPPPQVERNLFAMNLEHYPQVAGKKPRGGGLPDGESQNPDGKLPSDQTDVKKEKQVLADTLRLAARQLRLQSTVMSVEPTALINGRMVREGDVVASGVVLEGEVPPNEPAGFRVLKIEPRRVILEQQGIKLEITMK